MRTFRVLRDLAGISGHYATGSWVTLWLIDKPYTVLIWAWALPSVALYFAFDITSEYMKKSEA